MRVKVAGLMKSPAGTLETYRIEETINLEGAGSCLLQGDTGLVRTRKGVMVTARLHARVSAMCSRCLAQFEASLALDLNEEFLPGSAIRVPMVPGEEAFTITEGQELDLGEAMRQCLLPALPLKPLCHPRCAGLCPRCGGNLNGGTCACSLQEVKI